ncbi:hypothetical protein OQA88_6374 [Cercophora sp. LCS_1]
MKPLTLLSALTGLALPLAASAVQLFSNTGTTSGWSNSQTEASGTIQQVTNVYKEGPSALKMTQTYVPGYTGLYHSEVHAYNAYVQGQMRFYGFWFRLSENWEFTPNQGFNIAQFIAQFPGSCDAWAPTTMVWIRGNQLYTRYKYGSICSPTTVTSNPLATVTAGVWHKIVIQANWQTTNAGYLKLWYDGVKVYEEDDTPTTVNENNPFQFRVGLYANTWNNGNYVPGSQTFKQIWFDEIAFGTVFADADPDQW